LGWTIKVLVHSYTMLKMCRDFLNQRQCQQYLVEGEEKKGIRANS
jgi:hypothetical protein